jgi:hypothetical protein
VNVGILQFSLHLEGCNSLKEKRSVVQSIKERARRRFNLAIAEVDDHDFWRTATLGAVTVGVDARSVEGTMRSFLAFLEDSRQASLADHQLEVL